MGHEQAQAFKALKVAMTKAFVLPLVAWENLFYAETDARSVGLRAALAREHGADICLLVAYASRTLHDLELSYLVTKK